MTFSLYETKLTPNYTYLNNSIKEVNWEAMPSSRNGLNVIGLAFFSTLFGYVFSKMGDQGKILLDLFEALNEASIVIIKKVMW